MFVLGKFSVCILKKTPVVLNYKKTFNVILIWQVDKKINNWKDYFTIKL